MGRVGPRHGGDQQNQVLRLAFGHGDHAVRLEGRLGLGLPLGEDSDGDAAQILEQGQPQHEGNGPRLAERRYRHRLVGVDEARQGV
ncbi:MAG: hypothetical protein A2087_12380 [Spirochaetes bacterium GWD1_61_31]|nr:MAG: hypothetical protein A2087_12380 [Spirochaetes bacterium GWD1_61_31]OHD43034.1 MAG: hypothetical protein A2Y35_01265 [Spirochaetes bacterium GWE1_60_18]HAW85265.1 hypothetical protein [Spirochaetaceae bacterium]HBO41842.1 hypothetical protein [Spirochaetaceae bacterium]HCQ87596.1 hypothetical protein [Spirochaetaceae bacterium]